MDDVSPHLGRPTVCYIDHESLRWNFRQIRSLIGPNIKILSMIKANGYGHGAPAVARTLAAEGSEAFGVAIIEEAIELRRHGITAPILVLTGVYLDQLELFFEHRLTGVVHDADLLQRLDEAVVRRGGNLHVHLKIDTGMGRIGFPAADCDSWLPQVKKLKALKVDGVFSHFSHADSVDGQYTRKQLEIFHHLVKRLAAVGIAPALIHLANSAATITLPEAHFNMVRPGLMLYGVYPSSEMAAKISLRRVLSWKTRILQLKKVPANTSISYGQTFITKRDSLIATLPIGYADGYPRLLSNRGQALVGGRRAPVAGRVCMDLTMLDVTDIGKIEQGDEVVLLGTQENDAISADEMASWADTISYEILTSIGARIPRIHYNT